MCTVLLRWQPGTDMPVIFGAVRDEFGGRPWDLPDAHWPDLPTVVGGRDQVGGGTWLAVDRERQAIAAILNGPRESPIDGIPPTRGTLPLEVLRHNEFQLDSRDYAGFHLLRVTTTTAEIWSWDGESRVHQQLEPGDHIVVNLGLDRADDPLVPYFSPLLHRIPADRAKWTDLLRGDGLDPQDPRALIIAHEWEGQVYGSTSASLITLSADGLSTFDFTATPQTPSWYAVS